MITILTTKQVAEIIGVKPYGVYPLMKTDNLPFIELGRNYCFNEKSILQWKQTYDRQQAKKADVLKTKEIASMLKVSVTNVYTLVKKEGLPCEVVKRGNVNRYHFKEEAVVEWLLSKEKNKPAEEEIEALIETTENAKRQFKKAMPSGSVAA